MVQNLRSRAQYSTQYKDYRLNESKDTLCISPNLSFLMFLFCMSYIKCQLLIAVHSTPNAE